MIKIVNWKWLCDESVNGQCLIIFNHIEIQKGQWDGWLWNIAKTKKNINFYLGKYVISILKDNYNVYFKDCNLQITQ